MEHLEDEIKDLTVICFLIAFWQLVFLGGNLTLTKVNMGNTQGNVHKILGFVYFMKGTDSHYILLLGHCNLRLKRT